MALQFNAHLLLLNGLLPVTSVIWRLFPVFSFASINICLYSVPPSTFFFGRLLKSTSLGIIIEYFTYLDTA